jgi:hypothetical protein
LFTGLTTNCWVRMKCLNKKKRLLSWERLYKFVNYLDDERVLPKLDGGGRVCLLQEGGENV